VEDELRSSWLRLLTSAGVDEDAAAAGFDELAAAYSGPRRFYHNLDHVAAVLRTVDDLADLAFDLVAVRLAVWFHDAIYDSRAAGNEDRSAALAEERLRSWGLGDRAGEVARLVRLTRTHQAADVDADGHVLLDADLAILAAPPDDYDRYARAIRQEYAWVPDDAYREGRAKVLKGFLRRGRLFFTQRMVDRAESAARANLAREIAVLAGGSGEDTNSREKQ
jgi:predicted metal-dependent HD superfamily phosphohydrolase